MLPQGFDIIPGTDGGLFTGSRSTAAGMNKPRWAKITDSAAGSPTLYAWKEQTWQQTPGSTNGIGLADMSGGMFGTTVLNPAIEPNGVTLNVGDFVKLELAYFDPLYDWVFAVMKTGGGGGSSSTPIASTANGGSQSVSPGGNGTPLTWTNGYGPFWSAGSPTRFTVPAGQPAAGPPGGVYAMYGEMQFLGVGINYHIGAQWTVNGAYAVPVDTNGLCDGLNQLKWYDGYTAHLNVGDYVELAVWHDAPSALTIIPLQAWMQYLGNF